MVENHNLDVTNSFWSRPNHYGQVQINLVRPKPFWTDQNSFGHIEGQGINVNSVMEFLFVGQNKLEKEHTKKLPTFED